MKITVQNLSNAFKRSFDLLSPGVTIGRSPNNHIVLADPSISISLFQATITINKSTQIEIRNLAATPILVGDQKLGVGQAIALQSDSEFSCGDFYFKIESASKKETAMRHSRSQLASKQPFKSPTVMPMPGSEEIKPEITLDDEVFNRPPMAQAKNDSLFEEKALAEQPSIVNTHLSPLMESIAPKTSELDASNTQAEIAVEPIDSIFDNLFSGNGAVPVGADVNYDLHPFEMDSSTVRNPDNPLGEIRGIALDENLSKDPLEYLSRDGIEHQQRDILQDSRPSTMLHNNEQNLQKNTLELEHLDNILFELDQQNRFGK